MATPKKDQPGAAGAAGTLRPASEPWSLSEHAPALLALAAEQIGEALQVLQGGFDQWQAQNRPGPQAQWAMSVPMNRIKRLTVVMQQLQRFHGGRIRQSHEKVDLARVAEDCLQDRRKEFALLGIEMRRKLKPVDVLIDPTVGHAFINALVDWALPLGRRIDVRVDVNHWPPHARLQVRIHNDGAPPSSTPPVLDNLDWALARQIASTVGGIDLQREETAEGITAVALFQRTAQSVDGISAIDLTSDDNTSAFKSLQGIYALVVSPALQVRADVRDALREIGVAADSVVDLQQAADAVRHRMPSIVIVDAELFGPEFDRFRSQLLREAMDMPFVEISSDDSAFAMSGFTEASMASVGRGSIRASLGTAVMFELAKSM